tara:strand:- start:450 stop:779 length:330 start_codon:yes stop_codon:yes gene_type:complete
MSKESNADNDEHDNIMFIKYKDTKVIHMDCDILFECEKCGRCGTPDKLAPIKSCECAFIQVGDAWVTIEHAGVYYGGPLKQMNAYEMASINHTIENDKKYAQRMEWENK